MPVDRRFGETPPGQNTGNATIGTWQPLGPINNIGHFLTEQYGQQMGPLAFGRITEVYTSTMTCEVSYFGGGHAKAVWLGGVSYYLGAGDVCCPSPGDICLVWALPGAPLESAVILGVYPASAMKRGAFLDVLYAGISPLLEERHAQALDQGNEIAGQHNAGRPLDLFPGDQGYLSESGAFVGILGCLARLAASPFAAVTANLIDETVQVDARTLILNTIAGIDRTFVDRTQINRELTFATSLANALGQDEPGIAIGEANSDVEKLHEILLNEESHPIAKSRLHLHVGHNANLLHLFASKPLVGEANYDTEDPPAGIAEFYLGKDGALALRTAKSLSICKVGKIRLPVRKTDPNETLSESTPEPRKEFQWDEEHPNARHLPGTTDEPKYRQEIYEVQNYIDREDFHPLKTLSEAPAPEPEDEESEYQEEKQLCLDIRDDGSFSVSNSAGSSIEMTADGDIRISAARDLLIESGRHSHVLSGHDMNVRARKNIELTASEEGMKLKSQKTLAAYTKEGAVLLETESSQVPSASGDLFDNVTSGIVLRSRNSAPILLDAENGKLLTSSKESTVMRVQDEGAQFYLEGPKVFMDLVSGPRGLEVKGDYARFDLDSNFEVDAEASIRLRASGSLQGEASTINLTANSAATFFAPDPGVVIAHTHLVGDDIELVADPDGTGFHVRAIRKLAPLVPAPVPALSSSSYDGEAAPYDTGVMGNVVTAYRPPEGYNFGEAYETVWQHKFAKENNPTTWDLEANDLVRETAPFPGKGFGKRYKYEEASPEGEPSEESGTFDTTSDYVVFPD